MNNAPTNGRSAAENLAGFARQRTKAARHLPPLECGHRDPWIHSRAPRIRPEHRLAAYRHLQACGLAPRRNQ